MGNKIQQIEEKSNILFSELGFETLEMNKIKIYKFKERYHKFSFIEELRGFVIETAINRNEAENNVYEDSDFFCISQNVEIFLSDLKYTLKKYYVNK